MTSDSDRERMRVHISDTIRRIDALIRQLSEVRLNVRGIQDSQSQLMPKPQSHSPWDGARVGCECRDCESYFAKERSRGEAVQPNPKGKKKTFYAEVRDRYTSHWTSRDSAMCYALLAASKYAAANPGSILEIVVRKPVGK